MCELCNYTPKCRSHIPLSNSVWFQSSIESEATQCMTWKNVKCFYKFRLQKYLYLATKRAVTERICQGWAIQNNRSAESIDLSSLSKRHWTFKGKYLSKIFSKRNDFRMTPFQSNQTFHVFCFCQTRSKNNHNINIISIGADASFLLTVCLPYSGACALLTWNINYQHKSNAVSSRS